MKSLLVPLDAASVSFCFYETGAVHRADPIPIEVLETAVEHARANGLVINFIYAASEPPAPHARLVESVPHAKIVPPKLADAHPDAIVVVESDQVVEAARLKAAPPRNAILRLARADLPKLSDLVPHLWGVFQRLNLTLRDVGGFTDAELEEYGRQLEALARVAAARIRGGESLEMSFLTDRMILASMRNCEAGIEHLTVGLDGRLYLCPGFLADTPDGSIGSLKDGQRIPNAGLLALERAPLCRICDAFQCKRCVYLNKKLTEEINTPSRQQCTASHLERNAAAALLALLRDLPAFATMKPIPPIDYLDPMVVHQRGWTAASAAGPSPAAGPGGAPPEPPEDGPPLPPLTRIDPWTSGRAAPAKPRPREPESGSTAEALERISRMLEQILRILKEREGAGSDDRPRRPARPRRGGPRGPQGPRKDKPPGTRRDPRPRRA